MKIINQIENFIIDKVIDLLFWVITITPPNKIAQFALWVMDEENE